MLYFWLHDRDILNKNMKKLNTIIHMNNHERVLGRGLSTPQPVVTVSPPVVVTSDVFDIELNHAFMQAVCTMGKK